jgi:hypothetical protein
MNNLNLHYPQSRLSIYHKDAYYTRIKVFNTLPVQIKQLFHDLQQFQIKWISISLVLEILLILL